MELPNSPEETQRRIAWRGAMQVLGIACLISGTVAAWNGGAAMAASLALLGFVWIISARFVI